MMLTKRIVLTVLFVTVASVGCTSRRTFADRVNTPDWPEFKTNVATYIGLVDHLEKNLPPLGDKATGEQIVAHKAALAKGIRAERSAAKPGDIFPEPLRARFLEVVRSEMDGKNGKPAKRTVQEENPNIEKKTVPLAVNAPYPDAPPLATMPPTLLLRLPVLPDGLEYRIVGKALVLRDTRANIIADYIPNAMT